MADTQGKFEQAIQNLLEEQIKYGEYIVAETRKRWDELKEAPGRCNILVIGKTGVGKSTLINAVFRQQLAPTGEVEPVTQRLQEYYQPGCPITIHDSPGLELTDVREFELPSEVPAGSIAKVKEDVANLIQASQQDPQKRIHMIWYAVNSSAGRFETVEKEWLQELQKQNIPIVLVLTKSPQLKSFTFLSELKNRQLPVKGIIPVLAKSEAVTESYTRPAFGLDKLVELSASLLTEEIREIFIQQQIANLELTEKEALKYVTYYAGVAGATGLIPVPGVEIPLIFQIQAGMAAHIINLFQLPSDEQFIQTILTTIAGAGAGIATTSALSNLLKIIPGVGTITGEAISVAAASTFTGAFGTALVKTIKQFRTQQVRKYEISDEDRQDLINVFIEEYNTYLDGKTGA
ncbi:MAG: 50S ribosome-binding GTPase [Crocosphaera sp.]|nr:50S ribosome-binding GTPase [Crocosphaera sp.]